MAYADKKRIKKYFLSLVLGKRKDFFSRIAVFFLLFLSSIYELILKLRLRLYESGVIKSVKTKAKVISVGNITLGGTGKTPLVEYIIEYLADKQRRLAVVSRGYAGCNREGRYVADEPQMLKNEFPAVAVIINKDRIAGIRQAEEQYSSECVVLDDAFQNLKVAKDLDIICIDCNNPFGNNHVLPGGILRLPLVYLKNADIFMLTHADYVNNTASLIRTIQRLNENALIFEVRYQPLFFYDFQDKEKTGLMALKDEKIAVVCGIANPESLERTLKSLKAQICLKFYFEDHHHYTEKELGDIFSQCSNAGISTLVTTAKDEIRLRTVLKNNCHKIKILILKIKLKIEKDEEKFLACISELCAA